MNHYQAAWFGIGMTIFLTLLSVAVYNGKHARHPYPVGSPATLPLLQSE